MIKFGRGRSSAEQGFLVRNFRAAIAGSVDEILIVDLRLVGQFLLWKVQHLLLEARVVRPPNNWYQVLFSVLVVLQPAFLPAARPRVRLPWSTSSWESELLRYWDSLWYVCVSSFCFVERVGVVKDGI
jgi:hypothetical protein